MRILFIHNKTPRPFKHIAQEYASNPSNKVLYLSEQCPKGLKIPKVRHIGLPKALIGARTSKDDAALIEFKLSLQNASTTANALLRLKKNGFIPDIIYTTPLGGSLYVKDIFPNAFIIVHANWFYSMNESYNFFHKEKRRSPIQFAPARMRNLFQLNALNDADLSITSTHWQKKQYPDKLREKIVISPEGIDTDLFSPGEANLAKDLDLALKKDNPLVTFISKNTEAYRGLPQFLNCIPTLLNLDPKCHILICGIDKNYIEQQILSLNMDASHKPIDLNRIHVRHNLDSQKYIHVLRASAVHIYLTAPYALSSSILEALSCGCIVIGSDTAPVREIISHEHNGFLNDFWDSNALAHNIANCLQNMDKLQHIKENARQTILNSYDKTVLTRKHLELVYQMYNLHTNK